MIQTDRNGRLSNYPTTTKGTESKHFLGHFPCPLPQCHSSDAFGIWEQDGKKNGYCFSCARHSVDPDRDYEVSQTNLPSSGGATTIPDQGFQVRSSGALPTSPASSSVINSRAFRDSISAPLIDVEEGLSHPIRALTHRKLSYSTCEHFNVRVGVSSKDGETPIYTLFPRYKSQELVGWKTKDIDKKYVSTGGSDVDLFGSHNLNPTGKRLWITEGEEDAMAFYQVLKEGSSLADWHPPVVSIPTGSASAVKAILQNMELINGYEEVILVFDNDTPGKKARDEVCKLLAGKVSYITLPVKDCNQMLMEGRGTELKWKAYSYTKYQPDGIVNAKDLWERYVDNNEVHSFPYPKIMKLLNERTYGSRPGSIITITAGTGSGKTQFLRELLYHYYLTTDEKIAGMFLEEDIADTIKGIIALDLNKRIQLPDVVKTDEEEKHSFDKLFDSGRISFYDYFGGMDDGSLLTKLRYFASTGHKFIFLDHLSIVVSEYAAEGGERERIDTLMTKLAKFVKEFNVVLFLVVHLRKSDNSRFSFELGARPTLDDLRGSGSLKQLSWDVIGLSRNQQHPDPYCANTTEVSVLKCRLTGRTGTCDYLHFDQKTGRLICIDKPPNYVIKKKSNQYDNDDGEF